MSRQLADEITPHPTQSLFSAESRYFAFVREERQLCAILAHLLLTSLDNTQRLLRLLDNQLTQHQLEPYARDFAPNAVQGVELYLEFAFLRDHWSQFDLQSPAEANRRKREFIFALFARNGTLQTIHQDELPASIAEFNSEFMGPSGARWRTYIAQPGNWSVNALWDLAQKRRSDEDSQRKLFLELCRFKWGFNIKPDVVLAFPGQRPLCIEAKLLSPESKYPSNRSECRKFDSIFGVGGGRTGQLEMQEVLFRQMLFAPAQQLVIAQSPSGPLNIGQAATQDRVPVLDWATVLEELDTSSSQSFVARLIRDNAIVRYKPPKAKGPGWDGEVSGLAAIITLIEQRLALQQATHVGYQVGSKGGEQILLESPFDAIEARKTWKWRDPGSHVQTKNWIDGKRFLEIVELLRQTAQEGSDAVPQTELTPPSSGTNGTRSWSGAERGLEAILILVKSRAAEGLRTFVGYQVGSRGGDKLLRATPIKELEQRHTWKWRDPEQYGQYGKNWIEGQEFVEIVREKQQNPK